MNLNNTYFLRNRIVALVLFGSAILISYLFWDKPIAWYFFKQNLIESSPLTYFSEIISPMANLSLGVLFYFFRFWKKDIVNSNRALLVTLAIACSNFLTSGGKILLGRARPEMLFLSSDYGFHFFSLHNSDFSFPSGHACTVGAIVGALACIRPKYTYLLLLVGILASFVRVAQTYHYLSDILGGILIGCFVAQILYIQMKSSKFEI